MKYTAITKSFRDINGTTYWSSQVTDEERDVMFIFPLQVGYGTHSTSVIVDKLKIDRNLIRDEIIKDCKRRDVKAWGIGGYDNFNGSYYYQD